MKVALTLPPDAAEKSLDNYMTAGSPIIFFCIEE
jgi:hypothetical protein